MSFGSADPRTLMPVQQIGFIVEGSRIPTIARWMQLRANLNVRAASQRSRASRPSCSGSEENRGQEHRGRVATPGAPLRRHSQLSRRLRAPPGTDRPSPRDKI
jgi:hypothetical protein